MFLALARLACGDRKSRASFDDAIVGRNPVDNKTIKRANKDKVPIYKLKGQMLISDNRIRHLLVAFSDSSVSCVHKQCKIVSTAQCGYSKQVG